MRSSFAVRHGFRRSAFRPTYEAYPLHGSRFNQPVLPCSGRPQDAVNEASRIVHAMVAVPDKAVAASNCGRRGGLTMRLSGGGAPIPGR